VIAFNDLKKNSA